MLVDVDAASCRARSTGLPRSIRCRSTRSRRSASTSTAASRCSPRRSTRRSSSASRRPAQTQAFFDPAARAAGCRRNRSMVDGVEIFTPRCAAGCPHQLGGRRRLAVGPLRAAVRRRRRTAWFTSSRGPGAPAWAADWRGHRRRRAPARRRRSPASSTARAGSRRVSARIPAALACAKLLAPVGRVGFAIEATASTRRAGCRRARRRRRGASRARCCRRPGLGGRRASAPHRGAVEPRPRGRRARWHRPVRRGARASISRGSTRSACARRARDPRRLRSGRADEEPRRGRRSISAHRKLLDGAARRDPAAARRSSASATFGPHQRPRDLDPVRRRPSTTCSSDRSRSPGSATACSRRAVGKGPARAGPLARDRHLAAGDAARGGARGPARHAEHLRPDQLLRLARRSPARLTLDGTRLVLCLARCTRRCARQFTVASSLIPAPVSPTGCARVRAVAEAPVVRLRDVTKSYGTGAAKTQVLRGVSFDVEQGELVALVGQSGSGKSTLLNIIGGLDQPDAGEVEVLGIDTLTAGDASARAAAQRVDRLRVPGVQPARSPDLPRERDDPGGVLARRRRTSTRAAARRCAASGCRTSRTASPASCRAARSSASRSRARCSARRRCCCATSRPATSTPRPAREVIEFFRELNAKDGVTLLIVTHERRVSSVAKRVIAMRDGMIVETTDEALAAAGSGPS